MMKKLLCLLLAVGLAAVCLAACGTEDTATADEAAPSEAELAETPVAVYEVKTDYCTLKLPEEWKDQLKIDADGDVVRFSSDGTPLFDIAFNSGAGDVLGTIQGDTNTVVSVTMYEPDKQAENYDEIRQMYRAIDVITDNLQKDYDFAQGEALSDGSEEVFAIETNLTTLYYPKKWQDKVTADVEDNAVHFACGDIKLFDLLFGGDEGDLLGVYDGTEIRVVLNEFQQGDLSDSEYSELLGMRDAVNIIIEHLEADSLFESNK